MSKQQDPNWEPLRQILVDRLEHEEKVEESSKIIDRFSWPTLAIGAVFFLICVSYGLIHFDSVFTFLFR